MITIASESAVLYGYVTLSIVVLLTTNGTPVLQKKGFHFSENLFQNFQWFSHKKTPMPKMSNTVF